MMSFLEIMTGHKMRPQINLKKFLDEYTDALFPVMIFPQMDLNLKKIMGLNEDPERFEAAAKNCAIENLEREDDPKFSFFIPGVNEVIRKPSGKKGDFIDDMQLKTIQVLRAAKNSKQRNPFKRSREIFKTMPQPYMPNTEHDIEYFTDLLITIRIYRPSRVTQIGRNVEKPVLSEEFECLGSNLLTELRDKISCVCNDYHFFDISENPDVELPAKETNPGYFFITDTFYNDHRNPANESYSETVLEWAKTAPGLEKCQFKVANMESTSFLDLNVCLGFPQLYQHHANCEHIFTFSKIEVISPSTQLRARNEYPLLRSYSSYNHRLCNMCGNTHYEYIVEESVRQLHDPAYLCRKCFKSFHYIDGKKIGKFKAYRITGPKIKSSNDINIDDTMEDSNSLSDAPDTNSGDDIEGNDGGETAANYDDTRKFLKEYEKDIDMLYKTEIEDIENYT